MDYNGERYSIQLIDGHGTFNEGGVKEFKKKEKLSACGLSYAVLSIMGPQSSGKSTLLNHLFGTYFKEMDADEGRSQTTKGIWLAKGAGIEPSTFVLDMEGSDGRERGEDDTLFEKQSALFALALSDIVLINIWCHDVGRVEASSKPLLRIVFQEMLKLFSPRKMTLLFILRDKTLTPLDKLEEILRADIKKIWDSIQKPQAHEETPFQEFFIVEIRALSSYEDEEDEFKTEVANLRQELAHFLAPQGLAGDKTSKVPASEFDFSAQRIWNIIKENKNLDLPSHKVMLAKIRCPEIADENFNCFIRNKFWHEIEEAAKSSAVPGFGERLSSIIDSYLQKYDEEVMYFDEVIKINEKERLINRLLQIVEPAYKSVLERIQHQTFNDFKEGFDDKLKGSNKFLEIARACREDSVIQFNEQCKDVVVRQANWDSSKVSKELQHDIDEHIATVCALKLNELCAQHKELLRNALTGPVETLLYNASENTWPQIRAMLLSQTNSAVSNLSAALNNFDVEKEAKKNMLSNLEDFAIRETIWIAKRQANDKNVLRCMKDRFSKLFSYDSNSVPRVWDGGEDIEAIKKAACSSSLKLLSVMAAVRLEPEDDSNSIEQTLSQALLSNAFDLLTLTTWEKIPYERTLINPVQCKTVWDKFIKETEHIVSQAQQIQENNKRGRQGSNKSGLDLFLETMFDAARSVMLT